MKAWTPRGGLSTRGSRDPGRSGLEDPRSSTALLEPTAPRKRWVILAATVLIGLVLLELLLALVEMFFS